MDGGGGATTLTGSDVDSMEIGLGVVGGCGRHEAAERGSSRTYRAEARVPGRCPPLPLTHNRGFALKQPFIEVACEEEVPYLEAPRCCHCCLVLWVPHPRRPRVGSWAAGTQRGGGGGG